MGRGFMGGGECLPHLPPRGPRLPPSFPSPSSFPFSLPLLNSPSLFSIPPPSSQFLLPLLNSTSLFSIPSPSSQFLLPLLHFSSLFFLPPPSSQFLLPFILLLILLLRVLPPSLPPMLFNPPPSPGLFSLVSRQPSPLPLHVSRLISFVSDSPSPQDPVQVRLVR